MEKMRTEELKKSYDEVNERFKEHVKRVAELRVKDTFLNRPVLRVFISVPMAGRGEGEVAADIEEAKNAFLNFFALNDGEEHFEFVNTFVQEEAPDECRKDRVWYLGNSIKILSTCDIILFARGAAKARGCGVESHIAESYGIPGIKIYERYKDSAADFDYYSGYLHLFVPKKDGSKDADYNAWGEETDVL